MTGFGKLQRRYLDLIRSVLREGIDTGDFDIPQLSATAFGRSFLAGFLSKLFLRFDVAPS